VEKEDVM